MARNDTITGINCGGGRGGAGLIACYKYPYLYNNKCMDHSNMLNLACNNTLCMTLGEGHKMGRSPVVI